MMCDLPSKNEWRLVFAGVLGVALVTRLFQLDYNFNGDEIFSLQLVSGSSEDVLVRSLADKPHPPLHNILLHLWVTIWGRSEIIARSLSVLLSLIAIMTVLIILRRRVSPGIAACAGLVIALSGFMVYYGQDARPAALIFLTGTFNTWAFLRVLEDPRDIHRIVLWTLSAFLLVYSHYIGTIFLFVEACLLLFRFPLKVAIPPLVPTTVAGITVLPWLVVAFRSGPSFNHLDWIGRPSARALPDLYLEALGWPPYVSGWLLLTGLALLILLGSSRKLQSGQFPWDATALAAIAFLPPIIVFVLSHVGNISIWAPRQLITSAVAFVLLLGVLIESLSNFVRVSVAASLVVWAAAGSPDGYRSNRTPPWRTIVHEINKTDSRALILANENWTLRPLAFYARGTAIKIADMRKEQTSMSSDHLYFVCRAELCDQIMNDPHLSSRGRVEVGRYPWNTAGGTPRDVVFAYRVSS